MIDRSNVNRTSAKSIVGAERNSLSSRSAAKRFQLGDVVAPLGAPVLPK
jgi:hypothetical protein